MILYFRVLKALYGIIQVPILYYTKTIENLQSKGFMMHSYDPYVANKMIEGKQCTIIFIVDDMKISCLDPDVVSHIIDWLKELYQTLPSMSLSLSTSRRSSKRKFYVIVRIFISYFFFIVVRR